jgi:hypothetical protein
MLTIEAIKTDYLAGMSMRAIAQKYGVTHAVVRWRIRRLGIARHSGWRLPAQPRRGINVGDTVRTPTGREGTVVCFFDSRVKVALTSTAIEAIYQLRDVALL